MRELQVKNSTEFQIIPNIKDAEMIIEDYKSEPSTWKLHSKSTALISVNKPDYMADWLSEGSVSSEENLDSSSNGMNIDDEQTREKE